MSGERRSLMMLGGGENQLPLIRRARAMGLRVVLCDFRDHVPGIALSDVHHQVNTLVPEELIDVGRRDPVDGIVTNSEPAFRSMAEAAKVLGLRSMDVRMTELFKNKLLMREFCAAQGLPTPAFSRCSTVEDALSFFRRLGRKCILKPLDNSASRGVHSVRTESDVRRFFADSLVSNNARENAAVLMEEYVTGTEFTVDGVMTAAGHRSLAISEKRHYPYNENVACQLLFAPTNDRFDYAALRRTNDELVDRIGVPFCLTHAEYKYADGKFNLIEIQARGGGNFIATDIVPFVSGVDGYDAQIRWSVSGELPFDFRYEDLTERCAVLRFFDVPERPGVVTAIDGLDCLDALAPNLVYRLNFSVGDRIAETRDDSTRIGWYIARAGNRAELEAMMSAVERHFRIRI